MHNKKATAQKSRFGPKRERRHGLQISANQYTTEHVGVTLWCEKCTTHKGSQVPGRVSSLRRQAQLTTTHLQPRETYLP